MAQSRGHGRAMGQHLNQGCPWPKSSQEEAIDGVDGPEALKDGVHLSTVQATPPGEIHTACSLCISFSTRPSSSMLLWWISLPPRTT